ncbi:MAG: PKD domain-containing protein, partial [Gemmatimonadales bacterium]
AYPGAGSTPVHGMHVSVRGLLDALNLDLDQVGGNVSVLAHLAETGVFAQLGPDGLLPLAELLNRTATRPGARRPFALVSMLAAGGHLKQIGATTLEIENAPFAVSPDTAYFDGPVPEVSFTSDLPDPPSSYRIQWAWGDGKTTDNLGLPNASHRYDAEGDYTIQVKLLDGDGVAVAIDTVYALSGRPYWQITSISDPDEFLDLGDAGQSGPTYDLILRLLNAPKSGLIAVDRPDTATSVLRLRVLNAAVWDSSTCCPPAAPVPGEVREDLGISPAQATGVGPWFTGWEMNTWTQSTPSLGSGTMMGRHILGTTVYNVIDAGTQVGPKGALRIDATRDGKTMTGTIRVTIWWQVDDEGVLKIVDHGEDYRLPFTARRLR